MSGRRVGKGLGGAGLLSGDRSNRIRLFQRVHRFWLVIAQKLNLIIRLNGAVQAELNFIRFSGDVDHLDNDAVSYTHLDVYKRQRIP